MWKGRFTQPTSALVQRYGESVSFDWRLFEHDIRGSIAHAKGLEKVGILTKAERERAADERRRLDQHVEGHKRDTDRDPR